MKKSGNIVTYTAEEIQKMIGQGEDQTDWARVDTMTEEELEASIDWEDEDGFDLSQATPGLPPLPGPKKQVTVRVDKDVLDWFKSQGRGYQTRMNAVLRAWVESHKR